MQEGEGPEIDLATGLPVTRPGVPQYGDADYGQKGTKAEFLAEVAAEVAPTPPAECPFNADGSPNYQRSGGTLQGAGFSVYRLNPPTDSSARQLYDELASSAVDMYGKVRSGAVKLNEKLG